MFKHELRCEICHTRFDSHYNIPKVLACGHTICSRCLDRMRDKNINRCPFDRKVIEYDEDKVPNNFYILSLIDGSVKGNVCIIESEKDEEQLELSPKTVVNNPGWKNTQAGFIKDDILYTAESNGFIYCTDLKTGEWWFLYLSQFWGNHFFHNPCSNKMFLIDHNGSLFQLFQKNYYTQIGKKNSWKNTAHICVYDDKMYSVETSDKLYETCLENGRWKEIGAKTNCEENLDYDVNGVSHEISENGDNGLDGDHSENSNEAIHTMNERESLDAEINTHNNNNYSNSHNFDMPFDDPLFQFNIGGFNLRIPNFLAGITNFTKTKILLDTKDDLNLNKLSSKLKEEQNYFNVKDTVMLISTKKNILISNKLGELMKLDAVTGVAKLLKKDFFGNILSYSCNLTHVYFFEKGSKTIYRMFIKDDDTDINDYVIKNLERDVKVSDIERKLTNLNLDSLNKKSYVSGDLNEFPLNNSSAYYKVLSENNLKLERTFLSNENKEKISDPHLQSINSMDFPSSDVNLEAYPNKINSEINKINNVESCLKYNPNYLQVQKFIELDEQVNPIKVIASETRIVIIDKKGDLWVHDIKTKEKKTYQCLFMLRNCHLQNSIIVGEGDLVILDPIRLSLNKLNILTGTEVIMLHSLKFLSTIKSIFSAGTKLYFIDIAGNLYNLLEAEKKIVQIGSSGICRYLIDSAVHKNFLFSIENNILYKTNLSDGTFVEIKNEYTNNYKYFFADYIQLVFISKDDIIFLVSPGESFKLKKKFYFQNISKIQPLTFFKNHIIFYNTDNRSIDAINLDECVTGEEIKEFADEKDEKIKFEVTSKMINETDKIRDPNMKAKVMVKDFPEVLMFINNTECLACITKDGLIYKLYC